MANQFVSICWDEESLSQTGIYERVHDGVRGTSLSAEVQKIAVRATGK